MIVREEVEVQNFRFGVVLWKEAFCSPRTEEEDPVSRLSKFLFPTLIIHYRNGSISQAESR